MAEDASVLDEIKKLLGKTRHSDDDTDDDMPSDVRGLRAELARIRRLRREEQEEHRTKLEALATRVDEGEKASKKALEDLKAETAKQVGEIKKRHEVDLSLSDAGAKDPAHRERILANYDRLPPETRPKTPGEWWTGLTAAVAKDAKKRADVPRDLHGFLPEGQTKTTPPNTEEDKIGGKTDISSKLAGAKDWNSLLAATKELDAANRSR